MKMFRKIIFLLVLFYFANISSQVYGQTAEALLTPNSPIPEMHYKSWSLFLISDADWILAEKNEKIKELYEQFKYFGEVIGRDHLAVWFWSQDPRYDNFYKTIDIIRARAFCKNLELPPDEGPYVIVTTKYPGPAELSKYPETFPDSLNNFQVLNLNGLNASETIKLLVNLADKLITSDFDELEPDSPGFWKSFYDSTRSVLLSFADKITVTIKAPGVEVELDP
jgi:hypothetical protein